MVKIARGLSGQAEFITSQNGTVPPAPKQDAVFFQIYNGIYNNTGNRVSFYRESPPETVYTDDRNGWDCNSAGSVTIPANAALGNYFFQYETDTKFPTGNNGISYHRDYYQFEVVCMTTKITVVETYRDENVYRLTCTATPQGGTAPYTYNWSSSINGSQALSALDQNTLEVEIPAIGVGTISVAVSDSSTPPCTASASFDVCGNVNCDFTTSLISTPPTGDTGPYIYECVSSSVGVSDLVHEWSPSPIEVSADGTVAKFSFPDDGEHSINLSVTDTTGCRGFKTHKVGGYEFTLSTDPSGYDTGAITGTRDTMQFTVTVTAQATGNFTGTPPSQLTFEFSRPATGGTDTAVGTLVSSSPPRYQYLWPVRQSKGRWQIKVQGYKSNTATFKIDKREQIVKVAQSWPGAAQRGFDETPPQSANYHGGQFCDDLARYIYEYVGLIVGGGGSNVVALYASMNTASQDSQKGAIAFYHFPTDPNTTWRHNAVNISSGQIVDQNCGLPHQTDGPIPLVGQHSDVDPALVKASKYAAPSYYSTVELQDLDGE